MNRVLNVFLGLLSLAWYSVIFSVLFDYMFIDVSLGPVVGPCREAFGADSCRPLVRVFLLLMELPIIIVALGVYSWALVLVEKHTRAIHLRYIWLTPGVILGYMVFAFLGWESNDHISYYVVSALNYSVFFLLCVWAVKKLTNHPKVPSAGRP